MSWSVRGVDSETRERALEAAREAGVPVGEWLNALIRNGQAADSAVKAASARGGRESLHDRVERLRRSSTTALTEHDRAHDQEEVVEIAKALGRLLEEEAPAVEQRKVANGWSAPTAVSRSVAGTAPRPGPGRMEERGNRVERVLAALGKLDERVRSISERQMDPDSDRPPRSAAPRRNANSSPARDSDSLQAAIAEISARQHLLDGAEPAPKASRKAAEETALPRERPTAGSARPAPTDIERHFRDLAQRIDALRAPSEGIEVLRGEISALRRSVERRGGGGLGENDLREIGRLITAVDRLHREATDPRQADLVRAEIAELRDAVMANNVDGAVRSLELGYAHIVQRIDELRREIRDPAVLGALDERLNEIERGLSDIPRAHSFAAFDSRIELLAERIEELAGGGRAEGLRGLEAEMREMRAALGDLDVNGLLRGVDGQLRALADRLDGWEAGDADRLDTRLRAFEERLPERAAFDKLTDRMERISTMLAEDRAGSAVARVDERLGEILGRLDRIERQGASPAEFERLLGQLEQRIDGLSGKLDTFEAGPLDTSSLEDVMSRLDAAAARTDGVARIDELSNQIAELTRCLQNGKDGGDVEEALASLRQDLGEMRQELARGETLAATIEPRIQELARALVVGDPNPDDATLQRIEQQIAAIAGQLDATEERLAGLSDIEAALGRIDAIVARDDGESGPAQPRSQAGGDIEALRADLAQLVEAADGSRRDADGTVDRVQAALDTIVSRLTALEHQMISGVPPKEKTPGAPAPEAGQHGERPEFTTEGPALLAEPQPGHEADLSDVEDLPLEPGSGKPDLAALLRAPDPYREDEESSAAGRKASFIAAARRAAQAAAEDVAKAEGAAKPADERAGRLRDRLARGRHPVAPVSDTDAIGRTDKSRRDSGTKTAESTRPRLRRPLLVAAAAVILAIGALKVVPLLQTGSGTFGGAQGPQAQAPQAQAPGVQAPEIPDAARPAEAEAVPAASTPDKATTFQPPAAEPSNFASAPRMPTTGQFAVAPTSGSQPASSAGTQDPTESRAAAVSRTDTAEAKAPAADAATTSLGRDTEIGLGAPMPEPDVGALALRVAAANGNPRAQFEVAVLYTDGKGVTADLAKAREWYQRAAEGGLAPAQYRLGSLYEKGRGVARDLEQARDWYLRAAEQGNIKAMHNLAVLLADGGLGSPDFEQAAKWFKRAADHGVRDSQFNLGVLYARGLGVPQDMAQSYKWFAIAARLGDSDAAGKRDEIANAMQESQLAEARKAVEVWKQAPVSDSANHVVPDPSWSQPPAGAADAGPGDALVMQAQLLLSELGYDPGPADGVIGPKTRDAVRLFQAQSGLAASGTIDERLIKALAGRSI